MDQNMSMLLTVGALFVAMYFFMIRPESKRKKEAKQMLSTLAVGDQVTTIGGVVGIVCSISNDLVTVETGADRVRIQFTMGAISAKGVKPPEKN